MPGIERRRSPRANANFLVSYRGEPVSRLSAGFVRVLNLSELGMLLETPDQFFPGQTMSFTIFLDFDLTAQVNGRIAWYKRTDKGLNRAGIEFENIMLDEKRLLRDQVNKLLA